jgi:hypothetical protein
MERRRLQRLPEVGKVNAVLKAGEAVVADVVRQQPQPQVPMREINRPRMTVPRRRPDLAEEGADNRQLRTADRSRLLSMPFGPAISNR